MGLRWAVVGIAAFVLGLATLALTGRVSRATSPRALVAIGVEHRAAPEQVVLVFIDSLSSEVATDPELMPALGRLARAGASFEVDPCRDQLTYLCVRAALTGDDDSSLLAIGDNFRPDHEGPESLLSALAAQNRRTSVIGSHDFHPYRRAIFAERSLSRAEETPERVLALLRAARGEDPQLAIVSLASGDLAAHAHGVGSSEYRAAFRNLDGVVSALAGALDARAHLVVFGDHGHDALGRHLPGTAARTWAVYHGPAFRAGFAGRMNITDHRALLGILLGVPTRAGYRGPPLPAVFEPAWVAAALQGGLPKLQARAENDVKIPLARRIAPLCVALVGPLLGWLLLARARAHRPLVLLGAAAVASAVLIGYHHDAIRRALHDHGDSPERSLWLLLPLAVGCASAALLRWSRPLAAELAVRAWLPGAAACTVLASWLLLLPTAYYYGARRAAVLAALLAVAVLVVEGLARRARRFVTRATSCSADERDQGLSRHARTLVAALFVLLVLASLYQVRQLGGETASATWALDARIYTRSGWVSLLAAKLVLFAVVIAPRALQRPLDVAGAAGLLSACVLVELADARVPRAAFAWLLGALLVAAIFARRRAPSSLLSGALLLLDHLYAADLARVAAVEMILAAVACAVWLFRRTRPAEGSAAWATGLSVALAIYLMLWPTVGFHVAGIDFGYMFQWIPVAEYERWWWVIALGLSIKLALPFVLVVAVVREHLRSAVAGAVIVGTLAAKTALLSVLIAAYSIHHDLASHQATAMLAELALLLFAAGAAGSALPAWKALKQPASTVVPEAALPAPS